MRFSTASTTPCGVVTPMAVDPSCRQQRPRRELPATTAPYSRRAGPYLDGLDGILDLENAALRREGVHASVILAACQEHGCRLLFVSVLQRR